jgi:hypothetical protein
MKTSRSPTTPEVAVYRNTEYGKLWGMERNGAYAAARSGCWPVVWINGRGYIPRAAGDKLLRGESVPPQASIDQIRK